MSRVPGVAQVRAQFFYDTDYRCVGVTASNSDQVARSEKILFQSTRNGDLSLSNFPSANGLVGNQLFQVKAVRHEIHFQAINGSVDSASSGIDGIAELVAVVLGGSTFDFQVNDRSAFQGPVTMTPAGGGPFGFSANAAKPVLTNGEPTGKQIYALPLPIDIDANEPVKMIEKKYSLASGGGSPSQAAIDVVLAINNFAGQKLARAYIDGIHTRDAT
jgi:hypothetical protein